MARCTRPNYDSRLPARGVSQIQTDYGTGQSCYAMDAEEVRELQGLYVSAAIRAREAGFDIVNVYGGHCHTITHHFLDPFYNKRDDDYGGTLENRARFWLELPRADSRRRRRDMRNRCANRRRHEPRARRHP